MKRAFSFLYFIVLFYLNTELSAQKQSNNLDFAYSDNGIFWVGLEIPRLGVAPDIDNLNSIDIIYGLNTSLNYVSKKYISHRIVLAYNQDLTIFSNFPQVLIEGNYLIGKIFIGKQNNIRISSGISFIKGVERGKYNNNSVGFNFSFSGSYKRMEFDGVGLPIETMVIFGPSNIIGIGVSSNINTYIPYVMANLSFQFGKNLENKLTKNKLK